MEIKSKQGFHAGIGGNLNGWQTWWQSIHNAGNPLNAISADNAGVLYEIQEGTNKDPKHTLVFRFADDTVWNPNTPNYNAQPELEAERMLNIKYNQRWPSELDKSYIWLKDTNEIRTKLGENEAMWNNLSVSEWWGRYALRASEIVLANNYRIILLSPASGDHEYAFWQSDSMLEFLKVAIQNPNNIAIGLHEYSYTRDNILDPFQTLEEYQASPFSHRKVGRFELLFDVCDFYDLAGWPMLYFCEWGWEERNIPDVEKAMADIHMVTGNVYGGFYKYILGFGTWYLGSNYGDIHNQTNRLLSPVANLINHTTFSVDEETPSSNPTPIPDCQAITDVRTTAIWIPQYAQMTNDEITQCLDWAMNGFEIDGQRTSGNHMLCPSHVDALRIHTQGLEGSILAVAFPDKIGTGVTNEWFQDNCPCVFEDNKRVVYLGGNGGNLPDNPFFRLPVSLMRFSQLWGENPQNYAQFGLPGHDGVDIPTPSGTPIYASVRGTITRSDYHNNYGNHVRIQTFGKDGEFEIILAHLSRIDVYDGQEVDENTIVGLSGNTGNSTGAHLHIGVKVLGRTYTDSYGTWPYNFHNPMLWLEELYYNNINGIEGYLWGQSLRIDDTSSIGYAFGNLNMRRSPSSSGELIGVIPSGTIINGTSDIQNGYRLCRSAYNVAPPSTSSDYGLHLRADPSDISNAEYDIVQRMLINGGKTVKILHNHPDSVYNRIARMQPEYVIVRVMQDWGGRQITPESFYNWTADELIRKVGILRSNGITNIIIEVHNEPNLAQEGWTYSWNNGYEFGAWLNEVIRLYKIRRELSDLKFIFPGLSPGSQVANVRYDSTAFLNEAKSTINSIDGWACHAYWSNGWPMETAISHVRNTYNIVRQKLYLTEVSRNDRPSFVTPSVYGEEYAEFVNTIGNYAHAVYFFVGSASNNFFAPECWVNEDGTSKGIENSFLRRVA